MTWSGAADTTGTSYVPNIVIVIKTTATEGTISTIDPTRIVRGELTAYFNSAKLHEAYVLGQQRLRETISTLIRELKAPYKRPVNKPWYGDYATRTLVSEPVIEQNALNVPIRLRSKTAALDRKRFKRRRFLQQLRTT